MNDILNKQFRIAYLVSAELMGTLTIDEYEELENWKSESTQNQEDYNNLKDYLSSHHEQWSQGVKKQQLVDEEWTKFRRKYVDKKHLYFKYFLRYAAILVLPVVLGIYLWMHLTDLVVEKDIYKVPGAFKAELRLADGKRIVLDSMTHWHMQQNENVDIHAESTSLSYIANERLNKSMEYNTLSTPRGGEYKLKLADGTVVYMNAETTLRYPTNFSDNERVVEMSGEAYFEVAEDRERPFRVKTHGIEIEVLGTCFNINTYIDEKVVTTLLEGKVKVKSPLDTVSITPDLQAISTSDGIRVENVNAKNYVLWKDGVFCFTNDRLEDIMEVLSHWYDVEIFFKTQYLKGLNFSVELPKYQSINETLKHIEHTGRVKFSINGRTIVLSE